MSSSGKSCIRAISRPFGSQPFVAGPVRPFSLADNERYWLRDSLHFSEGMVPASIATLDDAQTWGAQLGAEIVGVPPTRGSVNRLAGTHVYIGTIDVDTQWQVQARAARFGQYVSPILADFGSYWAMRAGELQSAYDHFDNLDLHVMSMPEIWTVLKDAYAFHRRAWFIHFEVMYVLTANYLAFYELAEEIGLSGSQVSSFLSGQQTFYSRTDEELWRLAELARTLDVSSALMTGSPADMRSRIAALPHGTTWLGSFDKFLSEFGQRVEETCRIDTPSWAEDPSPALYSVGAFLSKPTGFDFHAARAAAVAERDAQIDAARRALNGANLTRFNQALASNQAANFAWWNEEHNYLIDRRAAIPVRRATLELGTWLASDGEISDPTDLFFLFKPELFDVMSGGGATSWAELRAMIPDRRAYFEHWRERGPSLPPMLGTIPEVVPDPIMIEVFGLSGQFLETMRGDGAAGVRRRRGRDGGHRDPRVPGGQGGRRRRGPGHHDGRRPAPGGTGRDPGVRRDDDGVDARVRDHHGVRVRHRRVADPRGDRQPRVRHPLRGRHRHRDPGRQDRRQDQGGRPGGHGPGSRVSRVRAGGG